MRDSRAVGWFWARRHRQIRRWRRVRNAATTIVFINLATLTYLVRLIKAKPSSSGQDDLGLASFDAIVAFQRPPAFAGFERCIGVLADPKTHIRAESWESDLFIGAVAISYNPLGHKIELAKVACIFGTITCRDLRVHGMFLCKILTYKHCTLGHRLLRDIYIYICGIVNKNTIIILISLPDHFLNFYTG